MLRIAIRIAVVTLLLRAQTGYTQWNSKDGILLGGTVVTMDDAFSVIEGGRVWVRDGKIDSILKPADPLPPGAAKAVRVDTAGYIYPGLIDLHNHPDYAAYPLLRASNKMTSHAGSANRSARTRV